MLLEPAKWDCCVCLAMLRQAGVPECVEQHVVGGARGMRSFVVR